MTTFGQQLRSWRHDAGLTQREVSEASGIHHTYLSKVETGHIVPSIDVLGALAHVLDVPKREMYRASGRIARNMTREELERRVLALEDILAMSLERNISIQAPEDPEVYRLCERWGYGAVMSSASRLWRRRDPSGAFLVGTCAGIAKSLLNEQEPR